MSAYEEPVRMQPPARPLADLMAGLIEVPAEVMVSELTLDSRAASPGSLFLACQGRTHHGLRFAQQAVARGARAVLYEEAPGTPVPLFGSDIFVAAVPRLSERAGLIAERFFEAPSQALTVAGVTGTNGKTTCAWLIAQALQKCGRPAGYMGTLGFGLPPSLTATDHTTSDAVSVQRQLAALRVLGAECVSMEVSSHALDQHRVRDVRFNTAVFTNLTRDHLDYHGTMEAYGAAKERLFSWPSLAHRIINIDDAFGARLAGQLTPAQRPEFQAATAHLVVTTRGPEFALASWRGVQFVRASRVGLDRSGLVIGIDSSWGPSELAVRLVGDFNVDNVLTVLAVLLAWNIPMSEATQALSQVSAPSGRMELFGGNGLAPLAIVDYAHTPDALAKALRAARLHCRGQLRVVFGCGGDRDAGKRPLMGQTAAQWADDVFLTDDNPRSEDPARIVMEIRRGMANPTAAVVEHDRARAIRLALQRSGPEDVVLIAGKGHEEYQIYGAARRPFKDQSIVRDELERLQAGTSTACRAQEGG